MTNMTYVQALDMALEVLTDETAREKLEALKAQLTKRSSTKTPTKTQRENEALIERIYDTLSLQDAGVTVTDLISGSADLEGLSCQKVSALLKKLVDSGRVEKVKEGKKTLYSAIVD